eukprot:TRINITY_DN1298_c1_g1_i4.p2 TRINITY_DN1298_c1_g1~~TRINITY_DN1298_c1_g1_i4.p2  ORF type:complete len:255 (-),score=80.09 TRINITY_DN1298_c1_g1_i4:238-1002(-)
MTGWPDGVDGVHVWVALLMACVHDGMTGWPDGVDGVHVWVALLMACVHDGMTGWPDGVDGVHVWVALLMACVDDRLANLRKSQLCNTALRLLLLRRELDSCTPAVAIASAECQCDGKQQQAPRLPASVYRMHELAFEINDQIGRVRDLNLSVPALGLPWTVVHTMDKSSPLYGATLESLARCEAELIVIFDGTDEGCSDTIQARWSYTAAELRWNEAFVPIVRAADGTFEVDFARFSDTQPVPLSHLLLTGSLS